jgi:Niemann-Pick C1 protein
VTQLQAAMIAIDQAFRKCPACRNNIINLWCAYTCDPYQGTFVNDTTVDNSTGVNYVKSTNFKVSTQLAANVYASCEWSEVNGALIRGK